jgi:hypothetical protein
LASGGLTVVMLGAVATHVMHAEWGMLVAASTILMLAAVRTWWGRDEIRALLSCRSC